MWQLYSDGEEVARMILFYLCNMLLQSFRFCNRNDIKRYLMQLLKILIFLLLILPACRTTRDTIIPQVREAEGPQASNQAFEEEIAMKFPEPEPRKPAERTIRGKDSVQEPDEIIEEQSAEASGEEMAAAFPGASMEGEELDRLTNLYLESLTLEQKIGQRFIAHIQGKTLDKSTLRMIRDGYISGIILYPWNTVSREQVKELTSSLQRAASENDPPIRLFICVDQEGGRVNAFKFQEVSRFPAPFYWAQYDDPLFIESAAYIISREIFELGCNMNFAPVLDVYGIPDRTVIGDRSMGNDPDAIGRYGVSYIRGARKAGIIPVMKHFPGHGYTNVDSHRELPVVELESEELHEWDMKPFRMAIEEGADAVMTSHVLYRDLDPRYPATLSSDILRGVLRDEYGFEGVIVSDGIAMGALSNNFDIEDTLLLSFRAGIDLILVHSTYDLIELKKKVYRMYRRGEISAEEIDEGVRRVLALKLKYGLLPARSS
jgi:beta-N-acetylhexosaminidase